MASVKPEKLKASETAEARREEAASREIREAKEIHEGAARVVERAVEPVTEGKEAALEFVEGKVSEIATEQRKKAAFGGMPVARTADEIEAIRAKLLQNLPPRDVMVAQIKQTLRRDQRHLQKQYEKAKRLGDKAAYQLNIIVAQLRKIREYFAMLVNATFEVLKQLWLKIVHKV